MEPTEEGYGAQKWRKGVPVTAHNTWIQPCLKHDPGAVCVCVLIPATCNPKNGDLCPALNALGNFMHASFSDTQGIRKVGYR